MHPGIEQRHQQLHQLRTAAAEALGQHIGAQQQHGARLGLGERLTHPAGVAAHQIPLQLRQALRRNAHIRQLAKAGVDPVNLLPGGNNLFNQLATRGYPSQRGRRHGHWCGQSSDTASISARVKRLAIQNQAIP